MSVLQPGSFITHAQMDEAPLLICERCGAETWTLIPVESQDRTVGYREVINACTLCEAYLTAQFRGEYGGE